MSKIPEGATHTAPDGTYRMARGGLWYGYADGDWVYIEGAAPHCYTKIQAEPEWTGLGLPPEGSICEVKGCMSHYLQWNKVTVFAVRGKTVFFDMEDGRWGQTDSHEFRTVRTPEQIASEKRDAAIKVIEARVNVVRLVAERIYDAGLRFEGAEE